MCATYGQGFDSASMSSAHMDSGGHAGLRGVADRLQSSAIARSCFDVAKKIRRDM